MKNRSYWVRWWWGILVLLVAGCCSCPYPGADYVDVDEQTYNYAQPKLVEWSEQKAKDGDPGWLGIVKDKGISWKARIDKAKTLGQQLESK